MLTRLLSSHLDKDKAALSNDWKCRNYKKRFVTTVKVVELEKKYQKITEFSQKHVSSMQNTWRKQKKNYVFGGLDKLNFTYITYKLAKSNLGNLCLQFESAPFISMLSPTCKFYMSSKFHKLFASPISKGQPPSRRHPGLVQRLRACQEVSCRGFAKRSPTEIVPRASCIDIWYMICLTKILCRDLW